MHMFLLSNISYSAQTGVDLFMFIVAPVLKGECCFLFG